MERERRGGVALVQLELTIEIRCDRGTDHLWGLDPPKLWALLGFNSANWAYTLPKQPPLGLLCPRFINNWPDVILETSPF